MYQSVMTLHPTRQASYVSRTARRPLSPMGPGAASDFWRTFFVLGDLETKVQRHATARPPPPIATPSLLTAGFHRPQHPDTTPRPTKPHPPPPPLRIRP